MRLIIGLGNPGKQYETTRHNVGFAFLEKFRKELNFPAFRWEKKFAAEISKGCWLEKELLLAKPQTFMNQSGRASQKIMSFYKLTPADIFIVHDELDLPLGTFRVSPDSRSAGHKGVQDVMDTLGTQKIKRIRIGIGNEKTPKEESFVLERFTQEEKKKLKEVFPQVLEKIKDWVLKSGL